MNRDSRSSGLYHLSKIKKIHNRRSEHESERIHLNKQCTFSNVRRIALGSQIVLNPCSKQPEQDVQEGSSNLWPQPCVAHPGFNGATPDEESQDLTPTVNLQVESFEGDFGDRTSMVEGRECEHSKRGAGRLWSGKQNEGRPEGEGNAVMRMGCPVSGWR